MKLETEIQSYDLDPTALLIGNNLDVAVHACGLNALDNVLMAIGLGKLTAHHFVEKLIPREKLETHPKSMSQVTSTDKIKFFVHHEFGIRIKSFDARNILLRIGKCCNPIPGDQIVGYITRGRGVSVHTSDCPSIVGFSGETERIIELQTGINVLGKIPMLDKITKKNIIHFSEKIHLS